MRLIDDRANPSRPSDGLRARARAFREEGDAAKHELAVEEGIRLRIVRLDGRAALLVEDAEEQIEPPQQLDEPLVHERLRHEDEHAIARAP